MAEQSPHQQATSAEQARSFHTIYGLRLDSTCMIPGVLPAPGDRPADVTVSFEGIPGRFDIPASRMKPWYVSPYRNDRDEPSLRLWQLEGGDFIRFRYLDETQFVVDRAGTQIWAQWPDSSSLEDTFTYLLGPVLGFVLRLRGTLCLHASLIECDGRAFAILGPVGAGKSTTAAALAKRGCGVLSEDVAPVTAVDGGYRVHPGYPRIRLWPDSASILFGARDCLPKLSPTWEKCYLDLKEPGYRFETHDLPLDAIYLLEARIDSADAPQMHPLLAREELLALVTNTYMNHLLGPEQRAQEFEAVGGMVGTVRMRRVVPHSDPKNLGALCELILDDFRQNVGMDGLSR